MGMRTAAVALGVAVAVLSGCASVPTADPAADSAAKTFAAPAPGKAGVYVYRNESMGAAVKMDVFIDGRHLGETAAKTYFYAEVDPGIREVKGKAENESAQRFEAVAGRLYYFWQEVKMGVMFARNELKMVDEATGKAGVLESKLILPKP